MCKQLSRNSVMDLWSINQRVNKPPRKRNMFLEKSLDLRFLLIEADNQRCKEKKNIKKMLIAFEGNLFVVYLLLDN